MHRPLPPELYASLHDRTGSVLLETARIDKENYRSFLFLEPIETLVAASPEQVVPLLRQLERWLQKGFYLAGYIAYEAGAAFEPRLSVLSSSLPYPLIWLGVYRQPMVFNHYTGTLTPAGEQAKQSVAAESFCLQHLDFALSETDYRHRISRIQAYIEAGDVYQINFTAPFRFEFEGSPIAFYRSLCERQRVSFAALIQTGEVTVISLSPELFFRRSEARLIAKPMKGTIRRGLSNQEDAELAAQLQRDEKNRAENLMITDLIRNDLGRIASLGSVTVTNLFEIERYETLFQMTSTVQSDLKASTTYLDIFKALFPCGSITGAPKIRAMEIIRELEQTPRGIYTGAIGFISPAEEAVFNVAIRTAVLQGSSGTFGVGSGIVWDSDPTAEYEECILKARFLTVPTPPFQLLETLLWDNGYPFLEAHLARLKDSAHYFDFCFSESAIRSQLLTLADSFLPMQRYKVRLQLSRTGEVSLSAQILIESETHMLKVALSSQRTASHDKFYRHKTTHRPLYEAMFQRAAQQGYADVLFFNEHGELTEGAISNVFVQKGDTLLTPPLCCGVLNGIYRQHILATQPTAKEALLSLSDLLEADAIFICNAVRGLRQVQLDAVYLNC